ncbi:LysR family transcriptional regulator [Diaphorobacter ruginosibacter]|uniref:LysR family transcriptional regulator n=1 Tax=Diaphorobacter ruginosibacter TaxID=1715720 RepID=A0A7G9RP67_9BURK|nr:LysR family transcriptional regulator [Diaphorobacter ruginosibacter]QNN57392.1 LysR family transcriptional regulator [Diaphorobacter ruginosibacter]
MDRLQAMRMFRAVVESRGFSAAADELGTTHSTASRQVKELEAALRVQLLNRNTRGVTPTEAGEHYYRTCVEVLDRIGETERVLSRSQRGAELHGTLRMSLPHAVGMLELQDWLPAFATAHPHLAIDLQCTDRLVDMLGEGIDVAVRISAGLPDSALAARKLTESPMVLVASPAYAERHGPVHSVAQLQALRLITYSADRRPVRWQFHDKAQGTMPSHTLQVAPGGGLRTDSIASAHAAAVAGLGIGAFTLRTVQTAMERGQLVRVWPEVHLGLLGYFAVYPSTRFISPAVRALVDHMAAHYGDAFRPAPPPGRSR